MNWKQWDLCSSSIPPSGKGVVCNDMRLLGVAGDSKSSEGNLPCFRNLKAEFYHLFRSISFKGNQRHQLRGAQLSCQSLSTFGQTDPGCGQWTVKISIRTRNLPSLEVGQREHTWEGFFHGTLTSVQTTQYAFMITVNSSSPHPTVFARSSS